MEDEMVWETNGWSGLGFKLNFCCEKSQTLPSLRNGSFHDVSILCTKHLIIFLLQQGYPTDGNSDIECLY